MENCRLCNKETEWSYNVDFKLTPVCNKCVLNITTQQLQYMMHQHKKNFTQEYSHSISESGVLQITDNRTGRNVSYALKENTSQGCIVKATIKALEVLENKRIEA